MIPERMDRNQVIYSTKELLKEKDKNYWKEASTMEILQTITFLRECFYGKIATAGRLQRFCTMFELK